MEHLPNTALVAKNLRLYRQKPKGKPNAAVLLNIAILIPNNCLNSAILIDQCLPLSSSKKLPPTVDGNKHRDPQQDSV